MNRVVIWAVANFNWLWVPLAEKLKRETGAAVSFICVSPQDAEFFRGMDDRGAIDDVVTINHFFILMMRWTAMRNPLSVKRV